MKRCPPSHGARCSTSFSLPVCFTFLVVVVAFTLSLLDYTMTTIRFYYYYNTSLVFSSKNRFQCLTAAPRAKFENNSAPTSSLPTILYCINLYSSLYIMNQGGVAALRYYHYIKQLQRQKKKHFNFLPRGNTWRAVGNCAPMQ